MQEIHRTLGSATVTWGTVAATPTAQGNADGVAKFAIPDKALLKQITLRLSGSWDQSVGSESQATEGNPVLITDVYLDLDGTRRRYWPGSVLYELGRIRDAGAMPKADPAVGMGNGKVFSSVINYDQGALDLSLDFQREFPYLDLTRYTNPQLVVVFGPFNRYVSGNTQANMTATLTAEMLLIPQVARRIQSHFEGLLIGGIDMNVTATDRDQLLLREKLKIRGYLLRVGLLNAAPITTALISLTNVGLEAVLKRGGPQTIMQKLPVAAHRDSVGFGRNGIALLAGYLFLDLAHNHKGQAFLKGNNLADLKLRYDTAAVSNAKMEIYQLVERE